MTIDYLGGEISSEPVIVPPEMINQGPLDLLPGQSGFIQEEAIWLDREGKMWINIKSPLIPLRIVIDMAAEEGLEDFIRIIRVEEGFILDYSDQEYDADNPIKFVISPPDEISVMQPGSHPVIGLVVNEAERHFLSGILEGQYGTTAILRSFHDLASSLEDQPEE